MEDYRSEEAQCKIAILSGYTGLAIVVTHEGAEGEVGRSQGTKQCEQKVFSCTECHIFNQFKADSDKRKANDTIHPGVDHAFLPAGDPTGYKQMYLETHDNLQAAIHIYQKYGYQEIPRPDSVVHSTMNRFFRKHL